MQAAGGEVDADGVGGVAGGAAVLVLFKEDGLGAADQAFEIAARHGVCHGASLGGAGLLDGVAVLAGHGVGLRPRAAGIGEDVHGGKVAGLEEGQRLCKFFLCLAGEGDDEVRRDGAAGEILPQQADALQIPGRVIPAVHPLEHGVAPGLEGEVELGAEIGKSLESAAQRLVDDAGLQGAEADAGLRNGGQDGLEQVAQGAAVVPFRAPGGDLDAGDDDLPVALLGQGLGLGHGICQGQRAHRAPGEGDDAVGAEVAAAVLDLEHGPGAAQEPTGGQQLKAVAAQGVVHTDLLLPGAGGLVHHAQEVLPPGGACHDVHPEPGDLLRLELGIAAADAEDRRRIQLPAAADDVAVFLVRHGGDGAGIDNIAVAGLFKAADGMPGGGEPLLHGLGLVLVDLAAQRIKGVFHGVRSLNPAYAGTFCFSGAIILYFSGKVQAGSEGENVGKLLHLRQRCIILVLHNRYSTQWYTDTQ